MKTPRLPITTGEVSSLGERALSLEKAHGNADLTRIIEALGIAGPFEVLSPWELRDERAQHLINAGGYAALPFGERYAPLTEFIQKYFETSSSMSLPQQSASAWRAALSTNLITLLAFYAPSHHDSQVFFSNSGAEAIETALKFARTARPNGTYLINFTRGYHGKTAGALSVTPNEEYQAPFRPLLGNIVTLPYGDAQALEDKVAELGADRIIGLLVEPIQGEGGVIHPPADFLPAVNALREQGLLVIADEIQTGLGRCGHWFASVALGLDPDLITLAKPLGGGVMPIGATIARREVYGTMLGGLQSKRHSSTFGGGSLAMAVGLKSLEIIMEEGLVERSREVGARGLAQLQEVQRAYPELIQEVRGAGMLFALQLQPVLSSKWVSRTFAGELPSQLGSALALRLLHQAGVHGCYTLNSSATLRLTPPLNIPEETFDELLGRVARFAQCTPKAWQLPLKTPPSVLAHLARLALR